MFTASALIATGSLDSLMTIFKNCFSASGWDILEINSSSVQPARNLNGREFIVRGKGVGSDPTRFYLDIMTQTDSTGTKRIAVMGFAGVKNYDVPVVITQLTTSAAPATILCTTNTPHNLSVGDFLIVNGNSNPQLNEGWGGSDTTPSTAFRISQVNSTASFSYLSVASTGSGVGGFVLAPYNIVSPRTSDQNNAINVAFGASNTASFNAFIYCDEYRICGILSQSSAFQTFYWGETERQHIPAKFRDRAFLSADILSGNVTASLNRSVTNLKVGQRIWFVHASGTTGGSGSFERTRITSRPTSASFGCNLTNTYPSGSIVGEDPLPLLILGSLGTNPTTTTLAGKTCRFLFHTDCTKDATSQTVGASSYLCLTDTGLSEANVDPDAQNYLHGRYIIAQRNSNPTGFRGRLKGFVGFANGTQTGSQEIIRVGESSSLSDYKNFPTNTIDLTWTTSIGPGAI